jgi:hypothetical protein
MEVDQVDHGESWLLLKRYQANFRANGSFTPKLGACVDTVSCKNRSKRVKRDSQSADWRKNRVVNEMHRWQTRGSADGHTPDAKYGGGRSIKNWQRVKSRFLDGLKTHARVLFYF